MDLDWISDEDIVDCSKFNEESIIIKNKKNNTKILVEDTINTPEINAENCFNLNLEIFESKDLLNILNYLSIVSNNLRTLIRSKSVKINNINFIQESEFDLIVKYLNWLKNTCSSIKKYFALPLRKDNSFDPNNYKLFKTSSYKFCNFKESCSIHKNKNKSCDKNHFVFDMIINDIDKLVISINLLNIENFNWLLKNKFIIINYNKETKNYSFVKIENNENLEILDNEFIIDKTLVFKSFDVISFVLNKMYEESNSFLNYNIKSLLINI